MFIFLRNLFSIFFITVFFLPLFPDVNGSDIPPDVGGDKLIIDGMEIFTFRAELTGFRAEARRIRAENRIMDLIERKIPGSVSSRPINEGILIMLGDRGIFVITPGDMDPLKNESIQTASDKVMSALNTVFESERRRRTFSSYILSVAQSVAAIALYILLLIFIARSMKKVNSFISSKLLTAKAGTKSDILKAFRIEEIKSQTANLTTAVSWVLYLVLTYSLVTFVLTRIPQTRLFGNALGSYLQKAFSTIVSSVASSIPDILVIIVIAVVAWLVNRASRLFFDMIEQEKVAIPGIYADTAQPTRRIVTTLIWVFGIIAAYPYLPGSGSEAFKGISIMLGLIVSLGSSGIMSQAMSGLILMYSRTFRPGDYVRTGDVEGIVISLGMLSTKIRNIRNEEITVPNAVLVGSATTNFTRLHKELGLVISTTVTIGYNTPWRQVHAMLIMAAERTDGIIKNPAPYVLQASLDDFYVEYRLHASVVEVNSRLILMNRLHQNIQDVFNEYGVQIMSPNYEADPPEPVIVPKDKWFAEPAENSENIK